MLEYFAKNPYEFTKPADYDEQVLKEMAAILNPYIRFNVRERASKLYSSMPRLTIHKYRGARYKLSQ